MLLKVSPILGHFSPYPFPASILGTDLAIQTGIVLSLSLGVRPEMLLTITGLALSAL
jgi:hypothetical protein